MTVYQTTQVYKAISIFVSANFKSTHMKPRADGGSCIGQPRMHKRWCKFRGNLFKAREVLGVVVEL